MNVQITFEKLMDRKGKQALCGDCNSSKCDFHAFLNIQPIANQT